MNTPPVNPVHWRLDTLLSCGPDVIDSLARAAVGTLTSYRVILGRCLLAMDESRCYKELGCSSSIHYATRLLGLSRRVALGCRRVARRLLDLPQLTIAAETGAIPWSKLREIVRKATIETEAYWLELASRSTYNEIQYLVSQTPDGSLPGEPRPKDESTPSELRCALPAEVFHLLEQARRALSKERGAAVTTAEVLEWTLSAFLVGVPAGQEAMERTREETERDMAAERARRHPTVWEARELALEMGLLGPPEPEPDEEDLLSQALGLPVGVSFVSPEQAVPGRVEAGDGEACLDKTGLPARAVDPNQTSEPGRIEAGDGATCLDKTGLPARVIDPSQTFGPGRVEAGVGETCLDELGLPARVVDPSQTFGPGRVEAGDGETCLDKTGLPARVVDPNQTFGPGRAEVVSWHDLRHEVWENERICFNRRSRHTTPGQKKELHRRDGYCCSTPGCPNHIWLQVHHIQPYSEGGATEKRNLICLCFGCHRNVHEGRLHITRSENGRLIFTDGEGRRLDRRYDLEMAGWLDFWLGWSKGDSHSIRAHNLKWTALGVRSPQTRENHRGPFTTI